MTTMTQALALTAIANKFAEKNPSVGTLRMSSHNDIFAMLDDDSAESLALALETHTLAKVHNARKGVKVSTSDATPAKVNGKVLVYGYAVDSIKGNVTAYAGRDANGNPVGTSGVFGIALAKGTVCADTTVNRERDTRFVSERVIDSLGKPLGIAPLTERIKARDAARVSINLPNGGSIALANDGEVDFGTMLDGLNPSQGEPIDLQQPQVDDDSDPASEDETDPVSEV